MSAINVSNRIQYTYVKRSSLGDIKTITVGSWWGIEPTSYCRHVTLGHRSGGATVPRLLGRTVLIWKLSRGAGT